MYDIFSIMNQKHKFYQQIPFDDESIMILREGYADDDYFYFKTDEKWCAVQRETGLVVCDGYTINGLIEHLYKDLHNELSNQKYTENYIEDCKKYELALRQLLIKENFN